MKILFINPPSPIPGAIFIRDTNRSGRRSRERTLWPQTSLAMMAGMFPEHDVRIWDCIAEEWDYSDVMRKRHTEGWVPAWVVVESVSCTFESDMQAVRMFKAVGATVAVISPHSEALHAETLKRYPEIDHLIDYEKARTGDILEPESHLRSLITGEPCTTPFEALPCARQDLLPRHRYQLPFIGSGYTFVITSRGCPWTCIYCRQGVTWKNRVRYRPVEKVIEEIERYGLTNVAFHADTFTVNRGWVLDLCAQMPKGVRWVCNSRVDTVDLELLKSMKAAGCWMICYGIESGNDRAARVKV